MDIEKKIRIAENVLDQYEKMSITERTSSKKVINTKFSVVSSHSKTHDLIRKLISVFLPKNLHLAQTNPEAVAKRLLKISKQKNVTESQKQQLYTLYERYKKLIKENPQSSEEIHSFAKLDQKWDVSKDDKATVTIFPFIINPEWADKGDSILVGVGGQEYLVKKSQIESYATSDQQIICDRIYQSIKPDNPQNATEYTIAVSSNTSLPKEVRDASKCLFRLKNDHILRPYKFKTDTSTGHALPNTNMLFDFYLNRQDCTFIDRNGASMNGPAKDKIAYTCEIHKSYEPKTIQSEIRNFLGLELFQNRDSRPKKIFIPLSVDKNELGHSILLVVEPSSKNNTEARITMINTHGDSLSLYREFEEAALKGAKEIYSSPNTTTSRNTKCIYTTAKSCGPDVVELARDLMDVENVQETVKKGLPRKTSEDDKKARLEQGEAIHQFLARYFSDEELNALAANTPQGED